MPPKKKSTSSNAKGTSSSTEVADSQTLPLSKELYILSKYSGCQSVGVDEAGRGPLAGPVVAAAVALLDLTDASGPPLSGVRDSKTVGEEEREALFEKLVESKALVYGVSVIERDVIDDINIFQATMRGMEQAVAQVQAKLAAAGRTNPLYVLIDGPKVPAGIESAVNEWVAREAGGSSSSSSSSSSGAGAGAGAMPEAPSSSSSSAVGMKVAEAVVKGDSKVYSIAAASLIAKVTRDRIMRKLAETYPAYGFEVHKGYGVPAHVAAIYKHGPCPAHRRSFRPVKDMVAKEEEGAGAGAGAAGAKAGAAKGKKAAAPRGRKPAVAKAAATPADADADADAGAPAAAAAASSAAAVPVPAQKKAAAAPRATKAKAAIAAAAVAEAEAAEEPADAEAKPAARGGRARTAKSATPAAAAVAASAGAGATEDAAAAPASLTGRKRRAPAASSGAPSTTAATAAADAEEAAAAASAPAPAAKRGRRAAAAK